jgi:hypothetical protein
LPDFITLPSASLNMLRAFIFTAAPDGVGIALWSLLCTSHQYLFTSPVRRANTQEFNTIMDAPMPFVSQPSIYRAADFAAEAQLLPAVARPGLCLYNFQSKSELTSFIRRFVVAHFGFEDGIISKEHSAGLIFASQAAHQSGKAWELWSPDERIRLIFQVQYAGVEINAQRLGVPLHELSELEIANVRQVWARFYPTVGDSLDELSAAGGTDLRQALSAEEKEAPATPRVPPSAAPAPTPGSALRQLPTSCRGPCGIEWGFKAKRARPWRSLRASAPSHAGAVRGSPRGFSSCGPHHLWCRIETGCSRRKAPAARRDRRPRSGLRECLRRPP